MYFRRYFSGSIENPSENKRVTWGATTGTVYIEKSRILGHAIEDTLKAVGMDCRYDDDTFILHFDKNHECGAIIYYNGSNYLCGLYISTFNGAPGKSKLNFFGIDILSGNEYKFCITLLGDFKSLLYVGFGTYKSPESIYTNFFFGYGMDLRDNTKIIYLRPNTSASLMSAVYISHIDSTGVDSYTDDTFSLLSVQLQSKSNIIALIPYFSKEGYFTFDNCFFGHTSLSTGIASFYLIDGEEYYYPHPSILIKCPTKINTIEPDLFKM